MIQRIQSIFLFLAAACMICLLAIPFPVALLSGTTEGVSGLNVLADSNYNMQDHPLLIGLSAAFAGIALINIFLFKNRILQMRIGYMLIALCFCLAAFAVYLVSGEINVLRTANSSSSPQVSYGIAAPILSLIFVFLANRFIKKDEKLVRSADRLR